jgi:hypothetical protein
LSLLRSSQNLERFVGFLPLHIVVGHNVLLT